MKKALLLAAAILLVSCGANDKRGRGDAPVGKVDDTPADVINLPDQFPNVATKCNPFQPGTRIYVVTHNKTDVVPIIVQDATCGAPK